MWYPPEVLQILPYQVLKRKVPEGLTSDMLTVACHRPEDTRTLIEHEGLKQLGLQAADGGFMRFVSHFKLCLVSRYHLRYFQH